MSSKKLIIDTDIGTDIDDALALVYAVRSGYNIPLITTVHGDTVRRAHIAKKLTHLLGADILVAAGEQKPLKQHHLYWYGDEGEGFIGAHENFDMSKMLFAHALGFSPLIAKAFLSMLKNPEHASDFSPGFLTSALMASQS